MKTDQELRELDAWIAEHLFGLTVISGVLCDPKPEVRHGRQTGDVDMNPYANLPHYTTSPADALAVLKWCAEIMREGVYGYDITIQNRGGCWNVSCYQQLGIEVEAPTLELAIVLFAKRLHESLNQKEK